MAKNKPDSISILSETVFLFLLKNYVLKIVAVIYMINFFNFQTAFYLKQN